MSLTKYKTYSQLGLKQTQNIDYNTQHTNTNTTMLWTRANQVKSSQVKSSQVAFYEPVSIAQVLQQHE